MPPPTTVKTLRILLLALLAALLPLRGALATAGHCAGSKNQVTLAVAAAPGHADVHTHGAHGGGAADSVHAQHHVASADGEPSTAFADPCALCTATCSNTSFVSTPLSVAAPTALAGASFPALIAPPLRHAAEGPERPPRSI